MKKVLLTGATGFTGSFVLPRLCGAGYEVTCFVRAQSASAGLAAWPVKVAYGDLSDPASLAAALRGQEILVNIASLGFGHAPGIIRACQESGVRRAIFFSTTALFTTLEARSKTARMAAEEAILGSGLDYTIIRPTMIYGTNRDRNMIKIIRMVDKWPVVPVLGKGNSLQQPVYVDDLAWAVTEILASERTLGKSYNLSGREPLTFTEVLDTIGRLLGKEVRKFYLPVRASLAIVRLAALIPGLPRFSVEQVLRLNENKAFSHAEAAEDFGYKPHSFAEGIAGEVSEYKHSRIKEAYGDGARH